jgi:hypothetical protein
MILVVIFSLAGAVAALGGVVLFLSAGMPAAGLTLGGPAVLAALVLFGFAQVIHALVRTAKASEDSVAELQALGRRIDAREKGDEERHATTERMAAIFERLGSKKDAP